MRLRKALTHGQDKVELQMTPMIDIVFQLLIFFIMTFNIVIQEGDFNIKMPRQAPGDEVKDVQAIPVRLTANSDGSLANVSIGKRSLAGSQDVFADLREGIVGFVGREPSDEEREITEVEIIADSDLEYKYIIETITAVSAYMRKESDGSTTRIPLIDKIKFAPPKEE